MFESIKNFFSIQRQKSLQGKIFRDATFTFGAVLAVTGAFFAYTNWTTSKQNAEKYYTQQAQVNATGAKMRIYRTIGTARTLTIAIDNILQTGSSLRDSSISRLLTSVTQRLTKYNDITLYHAAYFSIDSKFLQGDGSEGHVLYISTADRPGVLRLVKQGFDQSGIDKCLQHAQSIDKTVISEPYTSSYPNGSPAAYVATIAAPIEVNGKVVGTAAVDMPLDQMQRITKKTAVPEGASAYLISHDQQMVTNTNDELYGKPLAADTDPKLKETLQTIFTEKDKSLGSYYVETDDVSHFVAPVNADQDYTTWAMGLTIPNTVLYKKALTDTILAIIVSIIGLVICSFMSNYMAKRITNPINKMNESITKLGLGDVKNTKKLDTTDQTEIGQINRSVNNLIDSLGEAAHFANEIGKGNFNEDLKLQSENDNIGQALLDMKQSLLQSKDQEHQRQEEEQRNNWANEGLAKFAEILRSNHADISELSHQIISNLVKYLDINQGGLFVQNDNEKQYLDMTSCFAYSRRKLMERRIEVGEGLVGRCFVEAEPIYLLEIPTDYITITSGLGDTPPRCLLLVPLKVDKEVNGVIELASLQPIAEYKIKFVQKVAESIASTLKAARVNERTATLLEQTKLQAEEMAAAEEEMRQNLEELQSTQEEMARVQEEQKQAMDRVTTDNQMFEALLKSTSEFVNFKDNTGRYLKISESSKRLFEIDRIEDAIGKTASELFSADIATIIDQEDNEVMSSQTPIVKKRGKFRYKDGVIVDIEKDKYPVKNASGEVVGLISIYKEV
jgi:methyl-accepting chemotaxis protein